MDSIQPSTHGSVDQLHHLDTVLEKHLPKKIHLKRRNAL